MTPPVTAASIPREDRIHAANLAGSMTQPISEWMVAELLNDIGDPATTDPVDGEQPDVFGVLDTYLVSPQIVPRGVSGVDLVEFLDGYFKQQGASACGPMRTLVRDQYGFPYDFPACP
jgi:hypothetical protein